MIYKEKLLHAAQSLRNLARNYRLHHFAFAYPKTYFMAVLAAALTGYGFLLLFPLLSIVALSQLAEVAQTVPFTLNTLSLGLAWFGVFVFSVAISHHILTVNFELPKGIGLTAAATPTLFARLEAPKDRAYWLTLFRPRFHSVLLSEQFELEIVKTPVSGIPLWSKNTLVIGFPVMQTLSAHYFDCALKRKLIQYSKGRNTVTNWLYQLRDVWQLYPNAFSRRALLGEQIIVWFFRLYAPFYKKFSQYAAQQEELAADTMALREINDSDLFKTIQSQTIAQYFFQKFYLPRLINHIKTKGESVAKLNPFTTLPGVFRKTVNEERCKQWIEILQKREFNTSSTMPTISQRMYNMGQTRIRLPSLERHSAAEHYFGEHNPKVAQLMDNVWRNKINRQTMRRHTPSSSPARQPNVAVKAVTG
jgi:hypothetical protein